jgi:hypothetical protein
MARKGPKDKARERLRALVEEATVDCYGEEEQHSGLVNMILDEVECPFRARVIGEDVEVTDFDCPQEGYGLNAVCKRKGKSHKVDVNSLEWVKPYPKGFKWLEAYLFWRQGMQECLEEDSEE